MAEQVPLADEALIEIPTRCQNKYEFDKARGLLRLDRVLFSPVCYPADYGFSDVKLLGVPVKDPRFRHEQFLDDVPPHVQRESEYFFRTYKDLEGKNSVVWREVDYAGDRLAGARKAYAARVAAAR